MQSKLHAIAAALLGLFLFAAPASAGISLVGHLSGTGNTLTWPGGITPTNGQVVVVGIQGACAVITAQAANVVRALTPNCAGTITSLYAYAWVANSEPSNYTISTLSGSTATAWDVRVYSGVNPNWLVSTLNPIEGGNSGVSCPAQCTLHSWGTTTALPGEVFVSFFGWDTNLNPVVTAPAGLGNTDTINPTASNPGLFAGDLTEAAANSVIGDQQLIITQAPARAYTISFTIVPAYTGSPLFINTSSGTGTGSATLPSGIAVGDTLTACVASYLSCISTPSGWTLVAEGGGQGSFCGANTSNNNTTIGMFIRTATGSDTMSIAGGNRQSYVISDYRNLGAVDASSTCFTGNNCGKPSGLAAPSVTHQNDIVVQCFGAAQGTWAFNNGVGGENTANSGTLPDLYALAPAFLRNSVAQVFNTTWGSATGDLPFYGTLTNTPYINFNTNPVDVGIATAFIPTNQPPPPPASTAIFWPFP